MALDDAYATLADYKAVAGHTGTGDDAVINRDLKTVSRWLEQKLGRFFAKDTVDKTRLYVPRSRSDTLWVDDLSATPTSIKIDEDDDGLFTDETALVATDFELWPLNALVQPEQEAYTHIVLTPWGKKGKWTPSLHVQVVGKFGWPAVPNQVLTACIEFTRLLRLETPRSTTRITELEGTIAMSRPAQAMLDQLVNRYSRAVPFG
jgi:hypothetical protein